MYSNFSQILCKFECFYFVCLLHRSIVVCPSFYHEILRVTRPYLVSLKSDKNTPCSRLAAAALMCLCLTLTASGGVDTRVVDSGQRIAPAEEVLDELSYSGK